MKTNQAQQPALDEQIQGIEWDVISGENTDFAIQYPRMQWVHGSAQSAGFMKSGGLFISAENYPNFKAEGFEPQTLITRDGTEIAGFGATKAKIAVIRIKQQWVKDEVYGKNVPLRHVLAVFKGCDDVINISLRGASKSIAFQKAFDTHIAQNVALANRERPQGNPTLEPFALWFPVCAGSLQDIASKDGKSKSKVTPIEMCSPEVVDRNYVVSLWVGRENYTRFAGVWQDTRKWQNTPIWEQHDDKDAVDDAPAFTGNPDGILRSQLDMISGLIDVKNLDMGEMQEMCLTVSNGAGNSFGQLTRDEAATLIDTIRAM